MLSAPERSEFEETGALVELVGEAGDAILMDLSALQRSRRTSTRHPG